MIGASCTSGHPRDLQTNQPTSTAPPSSTSQQLACLTNRSRAPAPPAQSRAGGCSKGAAEAPVESRAPAPPAQSSALGGDRVEHAVRRARPVGRGAKPPSELASEVRLNDPLGDLDEAGWPLGDLLAVVEHEHHLAEPHHDLHVVLDQDD